MKYSGAAILMATAMALMLTLGAFLAADADAGVGMNKGMRTGMRPQAVGTHATSTPRLLPKSVPRTVALLEHHG